MAVFCSVISCQWIVVTGFSKDHITFKVCETMMSHSKEWEFQKPCCGKLKLNFLGQKLKANCYDNQLWSFRFGLFWWMFCQKISKHKDRNLVHCLFLRNSCTAVPQYPRVIHSKTHCGYVKPRIIPNVIYNMSGAGSSVGIATGYGLDGPGIESRWGWDFSHMSRAHPSRFNHPHNTGWGIQIIQLFIM
jgi:hypothetical protein